MLWVIKRSILLRTTLQGVPKHTLITIFSYFQRLIRKPQWGTGEKDPRERRAALLHLELP